MQIWPDSATLTEVGAAAPPAPTAPAAAGAAAGAAAAGGMGGAPQPVGVGEITLNRAESAALAALETEEGEATGLRRAIDESGLTREQVQKLKTRAKAALAKGFTLKGQGFVKKPQAQAADEPGLTRDKVQKDAPAKEANTAVLTRQTRRDNYTVSAEVGYGFPAPSSAGCGDDGIEASKEANAASTMAAMLLSKQRRKRATREASFRESTSTEDEDSVETLLDLTEATFALDAHQFMLLTEAWSDAARAASAAARRARAKGKDWRSAGRNAYLKSKEGRSAAVKSVNAARKKATDLHKLANTGLGPPGIRKKGVRAENRFYVKKNRIDPEMNSSGGRYSVGSGMRKAYRRFEADQRRRARREGR